MSEGESKAQKRAHSDEDEEPGSKKRNMSASESAGLDWNVDECRGIHESEEHWELRKQFLVENMDRFPKPRLICLSQVFANMEFLGCKYPEETMDLVQELSVGIVQSYREKQKSRLQRTFVKASSAAERKTKGRSSSDYQTKTVSVLHSSINNPRISQVPDSTNYSNKGGDLKKIILLIFSYNPGESSISIIHRSCAAAHVPITNEFIEINGCYRCTYNLGENQLIISSDDDHLCRDTAKGQAAKAVFLALQKDCYTFVTKVRVTHDTEGKEVAKEDISNAPAANSKSAEESVGSKLMKLMGWSGGGLGKNQQGIHEAISVDGVVGRSGLGLGNTPKDFKNKINDLLQQHQRIGFPYDLKFSADFTKEERKEIHLIAQRLGLRSKSFGKDEDRYIVVLLKTTRQDLLYSVISKGGITDKYHVILPGGSIDEVQNYL